MLYTIASIAPITIRLHSSHKIIVLATGFFDLLHAEHITFLQKARTAGDVLIAGIESDARARTVKGEGRPVETQLVRCHKVSQYADYVIALDDTFNNPAAYEELMRTVHPDIYAISSHTSYQELKQQLTEKYGGKLVIVHEFNPDISTSRIISTQKRI